MKKLSQISILLFLVLAISSCKKTQTCTCTETYNGSTFTATTKAKSTTMSAIGWCDGIENSTFTSGGTTTKEAWTCELK